MTPDEAIAIRQAMLDGVGDLDELWADVSERLAVMDPPGEWTVVRYDCAVRLYLAVGEQTVSKYVWRWNETGAAVERLLLAKSGHKSVAKLPGRPSVDSEGDSPEQMA